MIGKLKQRESSSTQGRTGTYMTYRENSDRGHHLQLKHEQQLLKMCVLLYQGLNFDRHKA